MLKSKQKRIPKIFEQNQNRGSMALISINQFTKAFNVFLCKWTGLLRPSNSFKLKVKRRNHCVGDCKFLFVNNFLYSTVSVIRLFLYIFRTFYCIVWICHPSCFPAYVCNHNIPDRCIHYIKRSCLRGLSPNELYERRGPVC